LPLSVISDMPNCSPVIGCRVQLVGLVRGSQHNGKKAQFKSVLKSGRVIIALESDDGATAAVAELSLKRENIEVVCTWCGLASANRRSSTCGVAAWCDSQCHARGYDSHKQDCAKICAGGAVEDSDSDDKNGSAADLLNNADSRTLRRLLDLHDARDWTRCVKMEQEMLAIVSRIPDTRSGCHLVENIYDDLASAYRVLDLHSKAIEIDQLQFKVAIESGDLASQRRTLANMGMAYSAKGQLVLSLSTLQQFLSVAQQRGDRAAECRAFGNLGVVYGHSNDFKKAADVHQKALRRARELGDLVAEGKSLSNLGTLGASEHDDFQSVLVGGGANSSLSSLEKTSHQLLHAVDIARRVGNKTGCMYGCMDVCMYVCMYVCRTYVRMYVCMYVCVYVCMYVLYVLYVCKYLCHSTFWHVCMHII